MELKLFHDTDPAAVLTGLNRTFYGIETHLVQTGCTLLRCLNRTFYGIETMSYRCPALTISRLNRTFYGIETPCPQIFALCK